jgi:hypothetical protein
MSPPQPARIDQLRANRHHRGDTAGDEAGGWAQVTLPPAPDPNARPPRSADDETLRTEIAELLGAKQSTSADIVALPRCVEFVGSGMVSSPRLSLLRAADRPQVS